MMEWAKPEWLYLLVVWAVLFTALGWWRQLSKLRLLLMLLGTLLLAQPQWKSGVNGVHLKVLVDRSDSAREPLQGKLNEWEAMLLSSQGKDDEVEFYDFADSVSQRGTVWSGSSKEYGGGTHASRVADALQFVLGQKSKSHQNKVLILGDGYSTQSLAGLAAALQEQEMPLWYRLTAPWEGSDYRLVNFTLPTRVLPKQVFVGVAEIRGPKTGEAKVQLWRDQTKVQEAVVTLNQGRGQWRFSDVALQAGAVKYQVKVVAENDPILQNNEATSFVEVEGGKAILLLTQFSPDPVADALKASGFEVIQRSKGSSLGTGDLSQVRAVILNNFPAHELSEEFTKALPYFVEHQGGGLMMLGGGNSFGSGGYAKSAIDPLMPVSMELKEDVKRLSTAVAYVLDRSGSMTAPVGGKTKMDLANDGTARSIELLGDSDFAAVLAVDSKAHVITPLNPVRSGKGDMLNQVRRIKSMGGGIFVHEGLTAAYQQLEKSKVGQRHMILFSDAADSEEPGDYKALLKKFESEQITLSVIGLGKESDADGALLRELGQLGGGRVFFCENAQDLPAVFAQETISVARSTFLKDPIAIQIFPSLQTLTQRNLAMPDGVDGYNLNYLRPGANLAIQAKDEYESPLLAYWSRGVGRVAAVSFPLAGPHSDRIRLSKDYASLVSSLTQWVYGTGLPAGVSLRTQTEGETFDIELYFEEEWREKLLNDLPELTLQKSDSNDVETLAWERLASNGFRVRTHLEPNASVRGAIRLGDQAIGFGPITHHLNPEWEFHAPRRQELMEPASVSGGGELVHLPSIWERDGRKGWTPLWPWMLGLWLLLMLLDAYFAKIGKARSESFWLKPIL